MCTASVLTPIKKTADYRRIARTGKRRSMPAFLIQAVKTSSDTPLSVGLTVSRRVGNAVIRSRVKRRMRAMLREVSIDSNLRGAEIVLIARPEARLRNFEVMKLDFLKAVKMLGVEV